MSDTHKCPATGCEVMVDFAVLACKPHWFALPPDLRRRISRAWKDGDLEAHSRLRALAVSLLK